MSHAFIKWIALLGLLLGMMRLFSAPSSVDVRLPLSAPLEATTPASNHTTGKIAFDSNRDGHSQIYLMAADGSGQQNLSMSTTNDFLPNWSPDGKQLAFLSFPAGDPLNSTLSVMDADGSNRHLIAKNVFRVVTWSPDSRNIAFVVFGNGHNQIYVGDANGSSQDNLNNGQDDNDSPTWSPDGKSIAFASNRSGQFKIYVMKVDGTNVRQLTAKSNLDKQDSPVWSPDGQFIVFIVNHDNKDELEIVQADGSNRRSLATASVISSSLVWSPDSKHIAFAANSIGYSAIWAWEIYTINSDGSDLHGLSEPSSTAPAWSSDSLTIAYMQSTGAGEEIYVATLDGANHERLTFSQTNLPFNGRPDWMP